MGHDHISLEGDTIGQRYVDRAGDMWDLIRTHNRWRRHRVVGNQIMTLDEDDPFPALCAPVPGKNRNRHPEWFSMSGRWSCPPDRPMAHRKTGKPITNECTCDLVAKVGPNG